MTKTAACAAVMAIALAGTSRAEIIYNSIPTPLPPNLPSLGYQATSTQEFGDYITFAAGSRDLTRVTATMSDWALASTYASQISGGATAGGTTYSAAGFTVPLTLNLYTAGPVIGANNPGGQPSAGSLIASRTITALIPWRPEATAGCGTGFLAGAACYNGLATNVTFDFSGVTVPDSVIFGLAFNTNTHGYAPTNVAGAYESLNFALNGAGPTVGTDAVPGSAEWNTSFPGFLTNGGAGPGVPGIFGPDTQWFGQTAAITFEAAVPEPASMALLGAGLLGLVAARRRRGN